MVCENDERGDGEGTPERELRNDLKSDGYASQTCVSRIRMFEMRNSRLFWAEIFSAAILVT